MIRRAILDNLKNVPGWRTSRRFVAIAVDDYANVRVASRAAFEQLAAAGLDLSSPFDRFDAMETRQDLHALFEVLDSVRDSRGKPAVITAYAVSANPDFHRMRMSRSTYEYEPVTATFDRLAAEQPEAYEGAWALWHEGRARGMIHPQFHGREHLNVELIERKLTADAVDLRANLENACMAGLGAEPSMPGVTFTQAFGLSDEASLPRHREILRDGLDLFEKVWGFRSTTFTPPAQAFHPSLYDVAETGGVQAVHKPLYCVRSLGDGRRRRELNASGRRRGQGHVTVVRNVVFEPASDRGYDPVARALRQIDAAFRWGKPAIISSHRVNFCGHLDEGRRARGLGYLKSLLTGITNRWPDVAFLSVDDLVYAMAFGNRPSRRI